MQNRWLSHTAFRYAAVIVLATVIPLGLVILAYDRYASNLLDTISGKTLEQRIAVMHGRLANFLEARFAQLDTLANYPNLARAFTRRSDTTRSMSVRAVLEYEADNPDLYGVLVFGGDEALLDAIPSQAAAGAPYWGGKWEPLRQETARVKVSRGEVIGPFPPADGQPGSFLLLRNMPDEAGEAEGVAIALHVRLSSLTELLRPDELGGFLRPLLVTPEGAAYSAVGLPEPVPSELIAGPELLTGWKVALATTDPFISEPLSRIREALLAAAIAIVALVTGLAAFLGARANRRIARLVAGSAALAEGKLDTRISDDGADELGVLAHAFNRMASRQRDTLSGVVQVEKMAVLGRFATSFAHEVRNPLAAVKTSVESIRFTEKDPPRRQLLGGIDDEIDRLDDILKGFLSFARPTPPNPRPVRVEDVLRRVELLMSHQLQDAGISFAAVGEIGLEVEADAGHLQQILMNLLVNAVDAMPDGGRLTVRVRRSDDKAIVEISDTGIGIAAERIEQMMEPFVTTRAGGSGLGLPISRQLAEMNGGSLGLSSAAGEGTTAILVLPRVVAPAPVAP